MPSPALLIVEDSAEDAALITAALRGAVPPEQITVCSTGEAALDFLHLRGEHAGRPAYELPALVLLDLGLPGEDGFAIARQLREHWHCGLVIVTGRGDAIDKVVGLEVGADDYVTKPFDLRELVARIKAVLRRLEPALARPAPLTAGPAVALGEKTRLRFAQWELDTAARRLCDTQGRDMPLTSGEFDLLSVFARSPGRVLSRDFLLEQTRGRSAGPFDRTIDVQVSRLRRKLEVDPEDPQIIKSVRGAGYILVPQVLAE